MACGVGPIQIEVRVDDGLGEVGVLGEEAVAGVHAVGARAPRDVDQLVDGEVGLGRGRPAQRERLVGEPHERGVAVGVGVRGDAGQPRVATGADDADGDLTTVRDEDLAQARHGSASSRQGLRSLGTAAAALDVAWPTSLMRVDGRRGRPDRCRGPAGQRARVTQKEADQYQAAQPVDLGDDLARALVPLHQLHPAGDDAHHGPRRASRRRPSRG